MCRAEAVDNDGSNGSSGSNRNRTTPKFMQNRLLLDEWSDYFMPDRVGKFNVMRRFSQPAPINTWVKKRTRGRHMFLLFPDELKVDELREVPMLFVPIEPGKRLFVCMRAGADTYTTISDFLYRPIDPDLVTALEHYSKFVALDTFVKEPPPPEANDDDATSTLAPITRAFLKCASKTTDPALLPSVREVVGDISDSDLLDPASSRQMAKDRAWETSKRKRDNYPGPLHGPYGLDLTDYSAYSDSSDEEMRKKALKQKLEAVELERSEFELRNPTL